MPYEDKVVEVREKMIGGKMSGEKLEALLNEHGREGWKLKSITAAEVKGRVGPGRRRRTARHLRAVQLNLPG